MDRVVVPEATGCPLTYNTIALAASSKVKAMWYHVFGTGVQKYAITLESVVSEMSARRAPPWYQTAYESRNPLPRGLAKMTAVLEGIVAKLTQPCTVMLAVRRAGASATATKSLAPSSTSAVPAGGVFDQP